MVYAVLKLIEVDVKERTEQTPLVANNNDDPLVVGMSLRNRERMRERLMHKTYI